MRPLPLQTNWNVAEARQRHGGDVKGAGVREEAEQGGGGGGRVECEAGLGDGDVGAHDGEDVVLLTASAAPRREGAVKDILLTALALNKLTEGGSR